MPYDPTTPVATETPAQSRPNIQGNFLQIATSYDFDHVPLNSGSNVGSSNKLTLYDQSLNLSLPTALANSDVLYSKTAGAMIELFLQRSAGTAIQMTNGIARPSSLGHSTGWESFLPGGLLIKFFSTNTNGSGAVVFATAGLSDFPNACDGAILTGANGSFFSIALGGLQTTQVVLNGVGVVSVYGICWGY
jgi:hypothetical protein